MRKVILTGILVGFSLAGCSTASSVPSPDVTGSYSTANLLQRNAITQVPDG